jgi:hypothetical protein
VTSLFSKPKMPDTKAQEARLAAQDEKLAADEAEQAKRETSMARSRGRGARRSSLLTGAETGLRESLG